MDGVPEEWEAAVGGMHRVVEDGRTLPWEVSRMPGGRIVHLGTNELVCPLGTTQEVVGMLAKAPSLASFVDAAFRPQSAGRDSIEALRNECRKAGAEGSAPPVGPWTLEVGRRCGVRSAILTSPSSEVGFLPIERKYLNGRVEKTVACLAVAASAPELMAACLCLADDPTDTGPCRFAVEEVVANLRRVKLLVPSRVRRAMLRI